MASIRHLFSRGMSGLAALGLAPAYPADAGIWLAGMMRADVSPAGLSFCSAPPQSGGEPAADPCREHDPGNQRLLFS